MVFELLQGSELFDFVVDNEKVDEWHTAVIFKQVLEAVN